MKKILITLLLLSNSFSPIYGEAITINPRELITPQRFDLMAKYIYAKLCELNAETTWGSEVYKEHLHILNNFCENDSFKSCLQDFKQSFDEVLKSIKFNQFDAKISIVPTAYPNILINGCHRTAACLLYNKDITCQSYDTKDYGIYDSSFFRNRRTHFTQKGLAEKYLDAMALQYCQLKKNCHLVIVFPSTEGKYHKKIQDSLNQHGIIVYEKKVKIEKRGPLNLVRELYGEEKWMGGWNNNFKGAQTKARLCFTNNNYPIRIFLFETDSMQHAQTAKIEIRKLFGIGNHSIHMTDTYEEALRVARSLFVKNSIHLINNAHHKNFFNFNRFVSYYKQWLKQNNINDECFCLDGSAILAVYGLRDCKDLDYLHHGYDDINSISSEIESHNQWIHHHVIGKDEIIFNPNYHCYYQGIKFASLDVIKKMKTKRNEIKDKKDHITPKT